MSQSLSEGPYAVRRIRRRLLPIAAEVFLVALVIVTSNGNFAAGAEDLSE